LQDALDKRDDNVFKAAVGLHGGIGGRRDVCGSLLGGAMMLGLISGHGPDENPDPAKGVGPTEMVSRLYRWFKKEFGTVKCRTINLKYGKEVDAETGGRELPEADRVARVHAKCDELCGRTAARTAEMIWDALKAGKRPQVLKTAGH
jgi:C_GCAxxG_C_C family probable redox protein